MRSRLAAALVAVSAAACGTNPAAPTRPVAAATLGAHVVSDGGFQLASCEANGATRSCAFSVLVKNEGPGCAARVSGAVTTYPDLSATALGTALWRYDGVLQAGQSVRVAGEQATVPAAGPFGYAQQGITWADVACQ